MNTTACKRLFSLGCVAHTDGAVFQMNYAPFETPKESLSSCFLANGSWNFGEHGRLQASFLAGLRCGAPMARCSSTDALDCTALLPACATARANTSATHSILCVAQTPGLLDGGLQPGAVGLAVALTAEQRALQEREALGGALPPLDVEPCSAFEADVHWRTRPLVSNLSRWAAFLTPITAVFRRSWTTWKRTLRTDSHLLERGRATHAGRCPCTWRKRRPS